MNQPPKRANQSRDFQLSLAALFAFLSWIGLAAFFTVIPVLYLRKFPLTMPMIVGGACVVAILFILYYLLASSLRCQVCGGPVFGGGGTHRKHPNAKKFLGISYSRKVAWEILTSQGFHCMHCQTFCRNRRKQHAASGAMSPEEIANSSGQSVFQPGPAMPPAGQNFSNSATSPAISPFGQLFSTPAQSAVPEQHSPKNIAQPERTPWAHHGTISPFSPAEAMTPANKPQSPFPVTPQIVAAATGAQQPSPHLPAAPYFPSPQAPNPQPQQPQAQAPMWQPAPMPSDTSVKSPFTMTAAPVHPQSPAPMSSPFSQVSPAPAAPSFRPAGNMGQSPFALQQTGPQQPQMVSAPSPMPQPPVMPAMTPPSQHSHAAPAIPSFQPPGMAPAPVVQPAGPGGSGGQNLNFFPPVKPAADPRPQALPPQFTPQAPPAQPQQVREAPQSTQFQQPMHMPMPSAPQVAPAPVREAAQSPASVQPQSTANGSVNGASSAQKHSAQVMDEVGKLIQQTRDSIDQLFGSMVRQIHQALQPQSSAAQSATIPVTAPAAAEAKPALSPMSAMQSPAPAPVKFPAPKVELPPAPLVPAAFQPRASEFPPQFRPPAPAAAPAAPDQSSQSQPQPVDAQKAAQLNAVLARAFAQSQNAQQPEAPAISPAPRQQPSSPEPLPFPAGFSPAQNHSAQSPFGMGNPAPAPSRPQPQQHAQVPSNPGPVPPFPQFLPQNQVAPTQNGTAHSQPGIPFPPPASASAPQPRQSPFTMVNAPQPPPSPAHNSPFAMVGELPNQEPKETEDSTHPAPFTFLSQSGDQFVPDPSKLPSPWTNLPQLPPPPAPPQQAQWPKP